MAIQEREQSQVLTPTQRPRRALTERKKKYRRQKLLIVFAVGALLLAVVLLICSRSPQRNEAKSNDGELNWSNAFPLKTDPLPEPEIIVPDWVTQDYITLNEYSRPGTPLEQVNGVVVHYVGNPGTTAKQNRSYFQSLATSHKTYASSHFIVDTDGSIIQCVPLNEISYCSSKRNADTIAIECCHKDETGEFSEEELKSLTKLLQWLIEVYALEKEDIIRHYDVTGKECPKYYVDHPDEWEAFRDSLF